MRIKYFDGGVALPFTLLGKTLIRLRSEGASLAPPKNNPARPEESRQAVGERRLIMGCFRAPQATHLPTRV